MKGHRSEQDTKATNQIDTTINPTLAHAGFATSAICEQSTLLIQSQASTSLRPDCNCIVCLSIGTHEAKDLESYACRFSGCSSILSSISDRYMHEYTTHYPLIRQDFSLPCRVPGCGHEESAYHPLTFDESHVSHERAHFKVQDEEENDKKSKKASYFCDVPNCKYKTARWPDLIRHTTHKHCTAPRKLPCPVIGCKYSGENGFTRKDKLKNHCQKVHAGMVLPGQANSAIRPATMLNGQPRLRSLAPK